MNDLTYNSTKDQQTLLSKPHTGAGLKQFDTTVQIIVAVVGFVALFILLGLLCRVKKDLDTFKSNTSFSQSRYRCLSSNQLFAYRIMAVFCLVGVYLYVFLYSSHWKFEEISYVNWNFCLLILYFLFQIILSSMSKCCHKNETHGYPCTRFQAITWTMYHILMSAIPISSLTYYVCQLEKEHYDKLLSLDHLLKNGSIFIIFFLEVLLNKINIKFFYFVFTIIWILCYRIYDWSYHPYRKFKGIDAVISVGIHFVVHFFAWCLLRNKTKNVKTPTRTGKIDGETEDEGDVECGTPSFLKRTSVTLRKMSSIFTPRRTINLQEITMNVELQIDDSDSDSGVPV